MKYFKNADLVRAYSVSDKAVRNWIVNAKDDKLPLHLHHSADRYYIVDDLHNKAVLDELANRSLKYKNKLSHVELSPTKEFYKLFSRSQALEIIEELDSNRILPMKYKYFGSGAEYWNEYLGELASAGQKNLVNNTIEALDLELNHLERATSPFTNVNIINLCAGNSNTMTPVLRHFKQKGKLRRFAVVDLSPKMLSFSEQTVDNEFKGAVVTEKYVRDLGFERFRDVLTTDSFGMDLSKTINLLFLVAGPLVNFAKPQELLSAIHDSMGKNDYLTLTLKRDTEETRQFFGFNLKKDKSLLSTHDSLLLNLLNIDESYYDLEQQFDERLKLRAMSAVLNRDVVISFELDRFRKKVNLKKGEHLPVWWSWHHSDEDIINRLIKADFNIQSVTKSSDNQLICLTVKRKAKDGNQPL